jgi:hypothetical protein
MDYKADNDQFSYILEIISAPVEKVSLSVSLELTFCEDRLIFFLELNGNHKVNIPMSILISRCQYLLDVNYVANICIDTVTDTGKIGVCLTKVIVCI